MDELVLHSQKIHINLEFKIFNKNSEVKTTLIWVQKLFNY